MRPFKPLIVLFCLILTGVTQIALAEEKAAAPQTEEMLPEGASNPNDPIQSAPLIKAKLTEEQVIKQLKYLMVSGWAKVEKALVANGKFNPMGMVLYPDGVAKPVYVENQDKMDPNLQLAIIAKTLKEIAQSRAVWGVAILFSQVKKDKEGNAINVIIVNTEHIAGWGRHWAYPYFVEKGELLLGQPTESATKPFYFAQGK